MQVSAATLSAAWLSSTLAARRRGHRFAFLALAAGLDAADGTIATA
jgi:hypothetical protein